MPKGKKNTPKISESNYQNLVYRSPGELKPYPGNARIHDEKQMTALMAATATRHTSSLVDYW